MRGLNILGWIRLTSWVLLVICRFYYTATSEENEEQQVSIVMPMHATKVYLYFT